MMETRITRCLLAAFLIALAPVSSALEIDRYPELEDLIRTMVSEDGYPEEELRNVIASSKINRKTLELMDRQWEALPWHKYRELFINQSRINRGVRFWNKHEALLKRAEATYGVPASVIAAIIGVETHYGTRMGSSNVLDSLVTLTAAYPRRSKFFKNELRVFLKLTRSESIDPGSVQGSFAGAIGIPQFMPSSYEAYSVDFNDNGVRDLVNEVDDAIGSVANYLKTHGWKPGQDIYSKVAGELPENASALTGKKAIPTHAISDLIKAGITFNSHRASEKAALVGQEQANGDIRYIVVYNNLYVITRYNNSINYAMAVTELSEELERKR
ncbi:MAG: lytic murein transglycosylase B [Gammaproteobacteria bacterium]|nr:lytic murein transglycosylase B [Gammaproteobacteria bacterium]MYD76743.1 lytic murein transglycosylase B [Gammaproteobacteria bacterium]